MTRRTVPARELRALRDGARAALRGRDLGAAAATVTYYSGIAVVPWLLLATWSTTWWWGAAGARERLLELQVLVPPDMGARGPFALLVDAGTDLGVVGALVVLLPASFYGEGLRRATLLVRPGPDTLTGWRGRALVLATVVVLPALAVVVVSVAGLLVPLAPEGGGGGAGDLVLRVVVGFVTAWLVLTVPLAWVFRHVTVARPRWWVAVAGALATASFLAGFLHGFQLFLAIPVDVGIPFGGLTVVGGVVAVGLWLFVLHLVVLVGWTLTTVLDSRVREVSR